MKPWPRKIWRANLFMGLCGIVLAARNSDTQPIQFVIILGVII